MERTLEEALTCPVCQEVFQDPRQLPCGHSLCRGCLENLSSHSREVPFRCPNCREFFGSVIGISKNYTLSSITEAYQEARSTGGTDTSVYCDCCPDKRSLAVKTCVKCEVSLCVEHVKEHLERPAFADHPLVKPLRDISKRKCPVHRDQVVRRHGGQAGKYICNLCILESNHQNQTKLVSNVLRTQLQEHQAQMDMKLEMMKNHLRESSQLIRSLQEDVQREKETPKKENPPESPANSVTVVLFCMWIMVLVYAYNLSMENQALKEAQKDQQNRINHIYSTIAGQLDDHPLNGYFPPVQKAEGVLMLDLDTANDYIKISDDLRTAKKVRNRIGYPKTPNRFEETPQVLSAYCFHTGVHMWEVDVEGYWDVAVSFRGVKHERGSRSAFGNNPHSWSLTRDGSGKLVGYHDGKKKAVLATLESNRVAVMVDIEKGNITFASVEATVKRLYEFRAELTQPVCLGLGLYRVDPPSIASIVKAW